MVTIQVPLDLRGESPAAILALCRQRRRWYGHKDLFTDTERARLAFLRWLIAQGRVTA